ncbi:hypothetical protein RSOLAG1IB_12459 [Rhizoctonia solani AG-1 IB]|uniref:Uncharacterized protein n=1 Tax=Thanatephorus cucumeris (strain AG1-IB / isolate 7/3/14) TaxID=1108050 RepID=A0A0B7FUP9_THACB|nr:hypothetical protein RSOLAG1IB_12459 [Rhizoctonia solani AG-1 IB]
MAPSARKGKGNASSNEGPRRRALERAIARHNTKRMRRAEQRSTRGTPGPLDALQAVDWSPSDGNEDAGNDNTNNYVASGSLDRSEGDWVSMQSANEAMRQELAHLRAMVERNKQLTHSPTSGESGSCSWGGISRPPSTAPVAVGEAALRHSLPLPPLHARSSPYDLGPRRFVSLPKSKTSASVDDIQHDAGLGDNQGRWLEISVNNVIRELMMRVGLDYDNSWLRQDKSKLGVLYALILKEAPELGIFQNGWATEWLVQAKFNNHRYYKTKRVKQRHSSIQVEDVRHGHGPPLPSSLEPASLSPSPHSAPNSPSPPPLPFLPESRSRESTFPPQPEPEHEAPRSQSPPQSPPSPPAPPRPQRNQSSELVPTRLLLPPLDSDLSHRPADQPPPSRRRGPRPRRSYGEPSTPGSRYNLRTRAATVAAAEAQAAAVVEQEDKWRRGGEKCSRKSESPLLPLDESDDGGRSTDDNH